MFHQEEEEKSVEVLLTKKKYAGMLKKTLSRGGRAQKSWEAQQRRERKMLVVEELSPCVTLSS